MIYLPRQHSATCDDRSRLGLMMVVLLCISLGMSAIAVGQVSTERAIGVVAVEMQPVSTKVSEGNAGLFVGVNQFSTDKGLRPLNFAVNDAIAQAHLFVIELKLITPQNTYLALAGEPSSDTVHKQLEALKAAGVHITTAEKPRILVALLRVKQIANHESDLLIVSFSSHGFESNGVPYIMPTDGLRGILQDTALSLSTVEIQLAQSKAGKRLLLVDACREMPSKDGKGGDAPMTSDYRSALAKAKGQAVIASCDAGQISFENTSLAQGVFTYYLVQGLRGAAATDSRGFITLGLVSDYVSTGVRNWIIQSKPEIPPDQAQRPWFKGPNDARDIPLAVDRIRQEQIQKERRLADTLLVQRKDKLRQLYLDEKLTLDHYQLGMRLLDASPSGLDDADVRRHAEFIAVIDGRLLPERLQRALDAIETPQQREARLAKAAQTAREAQLAKEAQVAKEAHEARAAQLALQEKLVKEQDERDQQACTRIVESAENDGEAMAALLPLATQGNTYAMTSLGLMYSRGRGVPSDDAQAVSWFRKAAEHRNASAMYWLGVMYSDGRGVAKNKAQALLWIRKAAEQGDVDAMNMLGIAYHYGSFVNRDGVQSYSWYSKAASAYRASAEKGDADAMYCLGRIYADGQGVTKDEAQSYSWYSKAASAYRTSAEKGDSGAMNRLGLLYAEGRGVPRDDTQAVSWFRKAAEKGFAPAMYWLGWMYAEGCGVPRDDTQAVSWYRKAEKMGFTGVKYDALKKIKLK